MTSPLDVSDLPLFTLVNNARAQPSRQPILAAPLLPESGPISEKGPILRGLASRAPYFHNGSAATLANVLVFYDMRFNIGFTPQEKADLIAFLNSL